LQAWAWEPLIDQQLVKAPSLQATAVLHAIAMLAQVDEASQWARRLAVETWLLPTQPPKLFGSTPFRQELADSSTRNLCDCCCRKIMSGETWWHACNVDVCEACLAAARRFDTSSYHARHAHASVQAIFGGEPRQPPQVAQGSCA
jgi:hypothetical protein